jgi:DNA-binding transcriptional ArsR family regulator
LFPDEAMTGHTLTEGLPATFAHRRRVEDARKAIHGPATLRGLSQTFKVLGDESRLKICLVLSRQELCVGDIAGLVGLTESAVSHQLRIMKAMRLVTYRREGKMTYYMLDDEHIEELIRLGVRHVSE